MKISVCTDAVYMGMSLIEAVDEVKKAGIDAVEFWTWQDKDLDALVQYKEKNDIQIAAFCTEFVSLVDKTVRQEYIEGLKCTIEAAKKVGCKCIISQTGAELPIDRREQYSSLVDGLKACVPYLEESGIVLVVEPLNTRVDHEGYYLSRSDEAYAIMKEVNSPYVKMLFDIYHQQITEGDLIRRIQEYIPYIGHFHAAGNPGRHELYHSEVDYGKVFEAIKATGYDGYMGLEYFPLDEQSKGIEFAKRIIS